VQFTCGRQRSTAACTRTQSVPEMVQPTSETDTCVSDRKAARVPLGSSGEPSRERGAMRTEIADNPPHRFALPAHWTPIVHGSAEPAGHGVGALSRRRRYDALPLPRFRTPTRSSPRSEIPSASPRRSTRSHGSRLRCQLVPVGPGQMPVGADPTHSIGAGRAVPGPGGGTGSCPPLERAEEPRAAWAARILSPWWAPEWQCRGERAVVMTAPPPRRGRPGRTIGSAPRMRSCSGSRQRVSVRDIAVRVGPTVCG